MIVAGFGRTAAFIGFLILAGCAGDQGGSSRGAPVTGVSASCDRACNAEYDSCMGRFSGPADDSSFGRLSDDQSGKLGPNTICPDQMKSCRSRCLP